MHIKTLSFLWISLFSYHYNTKYQHKHEWIYYNLNIVCALVSYVSIIIERVWVFASKKVMLCVVLPYPFQNAAICSNEFWTGYINALVMWSLTRNIFCCRNGTTFWILTYKQYVYTALYPSSTSQDTLINAMKALTHTNMLKTQLTIHAISY